MMVYVIVKIVANLGILKDWFECQYSVTRNLLDLYNDFNSGSINMVRADVLSFHATVA